MHRFVARPISDGPMAVETGKSENDHAVVIQHRLEREPHFLVASPVPMQLERLRDNPNTVLAFHEALGCPYKPPELCRFDPARHEFVRRSAFLAKPSDKRAEQLARLLLADLRTKEADRVDDRIDAAEAVEVALGKGL